MVDALFDDLIGWLHVDHLGRTRVTNTTYTADKQNGMVIDAQALVVDAVVVILGAFKDNSFGFEYALVAGL